MIRAGCGRTCSTLGGTDKCPECGEVDVHNYRALHDGRMKRREYPARFANLQEMRAAGGPWACRVSDCATEMLQGPGACTGHREGPMDDNQPQDPDDRLTTIYY